MGLLDKFRNRRNKKDNNIVPSEKDIYEITFDKNQDGQYVELYDTEADFKQFYDVTRLVDTGKVKQIEGHTLHEYLVSWYGHSDCTGCSINSEEGASRTDYKRIIAELDMDLLKEDSEYLKVVMLNLLEQRRVEGLLNNGLRENCKTPTGNYVGGVRKRLDGSRYETFLDLEIGKASHFSKEMIEKRNQQKVRKQSKQSKRTEMEHSL